MFEIKYFIYTPTGIEHHGEVIDFKNDFDVSEYKTCGFKHTIPVPTSEELDKLHREEFYSTEKVTYLV